MKVEIMFISFEWNPLGARRRQVHSLAPRSCHSARLTTRKPSWAESEEEEKELRNESIAKCFRRELFSWPRPLERLIWAPKSGKCGAPAA